MKPDIKLGRVFGIQIGLHFSWFLIALLIVFSLTGQFSAVHPEWGIGTIWALAIVTGVIFFACLLLHELAHSVVAKSFGIPVRSITLFALGGVAQIEKGAANARQEFWIAIVGPITSAVIGGIFLGLASALGSPESTPLTTMLFWLGYINLGLAVFNMVPGYPLDGGRVLRALIWWKTGDVDRSTRIASQVGQAVAFVFIALGIFRFFAGAGFGGLWLAFIGWFLLQASKESYVELGLRRTMERVHVGDIMARDCAMVDAQSDVQTFVEEQLLRTGRRCFVVADNGDVVGLVTPHEVREVERRKWPFTTLRDIMRPLSRMRTVTPDTPLAEAVEVMGRDDVNQLPVVSKGRLEGVLSRGQVLRYFQHVSELQA